MREQLEELVAGGVGPLLFGQGQESGDQGCGVGGASRADVGVGLVVVGEDGASDGRNCYAFAPRGVFGAFAGGVDGADADHTGPLPVGVQGFFLVVVSGGTDDDNTEGVGAGDRPLHRAARVTA